MILFLKDWYNYPGAIVHRTTRNTSFLDIAEKIKAMGVKNYFYMLALHNPTLEHVDPFAPNLDIFTQGMIAEECKNNFWYYIRECARVPPQGGAPTGLPLRANRGNIALFWCFFTHIRPYLIQPRQTGKSLGSDLLMSYLLYIACKDTRINLFTKDNSLRAANIDRLKEIREYLPEYLQLRSKDDSDNSIEVTCVANNNVYATAVAQANPVAANKVGRGFTSPINVVDEGPFCSHIAHTFSAMLASGTAARLEAIQFGTPYGTILTTTAGKKDEASGKYMYELLQGGMPWSEHLYDSEHEEHLQDIVEKGSSGLMPLVNITLSHKQLGYTDAWLLKQLKDNNSKGEEADRDFFNKWTSGSLTSPLLTIVNDRIRDSKRDPKYVEITKENYTIRWYLTKQELEARMLTSKFIAGADTSEGVGRDSMTLVIVDAATLEVVGASAVNETNIIRYAKFIANFLAKYDNIILVPERRSTGSTIIDMLLIDLPEKGIDPFTRIFNLVIDDPEYYSDDYAIIRQDLNRRPPKYHEKCKRFFGFATSGSGRFSRDDLYSTVLQRAALLGCDNVRDTALINEITALQTKNNRIDHSSGGHDDMVIAWMLAAWFLMSTRNLAMYGIYDALAEAKEFNPYATEEPVLQAHELYHKQQQNKIRKEIEVLLEQIKEARDDLVVTRLTYAIKALDQKLADSYDSDLLTIDSVINNVKSERAKRIREAQHARRRQSAYYDYS